MSLNSRFSLYRFFTVLWCFFSVSIFTGCPEEQTSTLDTLKESYRTRQIIDLTDLNDTQNSIAFRVRDAVNYAELKHNTPHITAGRLVLRLNDDNEFLIEALELELEPLTVPYGNNILTYGNFKIKLGIQAKLLPTWQATQENAFDGSGLTDFIVSWSRFLNDNVMPEQTVLLRDEQIALSTYINNLQQTTIELNAALNSTIWSDEFIIVDQLILQIDHFTNE